MRKQQPPRRSPGDITILLNQPYEDRRAVIYKVLPLAYDELRRIAAGKLRAERAGHTLTPTDVVHESACRLLKWESRGFCNRAHFFTAASRVMDHFLIDYARRHNSLIRGGACEHVPLEEIDIAARTDESGYEALLTAMARLKESEPRLYELVRMRYDLGFSTGEIALLLKAGDSTVRRDLKTALDTLRVYLT